MGKLIIKWEMAKILESSGVYGASICGFASSLNLHVESFMSTKIFFTSS